MQANSENNILAIDENNKKTDISVIIVNFNGRKFLEECLNSLNKYLENYNFEIIVVDNLSTDSSQDFLSKRPDILYIPSQKNLGFTGGNNLGAKYASGSVFLFINNDTKVCSSLTPMLNLLNCKDTGIGSCRLVYGDNRQQYSFGFDHTPIRIIFSWLGLEKRPKLPKIFKKLDTNPEQYKLHHSSLDWVSGACFAIKREVWEKVGGFDTNIFMYCEDVDLCLRVRKLGLNVSYTPETIVTHYEGAGKPWIGEAALKRTTNSYLYFVKKHYGRYWLIFVAYSLVLIFFIRSLIFALAFIFKPNSKNILIQKSKGYFNISIYILLRNPFDISRASRA